LNAANEIAVDKFINKKIKFSQISDLIKNALDKIENHSDPDIETIFECDRATREFVSSLN
jgi:1-deoxy-D-xylulose-5-phosphate reductoisomerase